MNDIKNGQKTAIIYDDHEEVEVIRLKLNNKTTNITLISSDDIDVSNSKYDVVITLVKNTDESLQAILSGLNRNGCYISKSKDTSGTEFQLKTNGFINVSINADQEIVGFKPSYDVGSSAKVKPSALVWLMDGDDDEIIDPDNLLDEDDLKKPNKESLRVCGTTGKRKACKDCSCGLADELAMDGTDGKLIDTGNAPKSSCGSCYLGDAFRCAECPYLGMPAFKPGEKVQLSANLLKDDL